MPPIRLDPHRNHPRVVPPQLRGVVQPEARPVEGTGTALRRRRVVRLQEVVPRHRRLQRVPGLRWEAESLGAASPARDHGVADHRLGVRFVAPPAGALGEFLYLGGGLALVEDHVLEAVPGAGSVEGLVLGKREKGGIN